MTRTPTLKATAGAFALIAAAALATSACGREGSLERPGPMFGLSRTADDPQAQPTGSTTSERRAKDAHSAATANTTADGNTTGSAASNDDNVPITKHDLRDPAQRLTPLSASPIQGLSDPLGPPVSTKPPG